MERYESSADQYTHPNSDSKRLYASSDQKVAHIRPETNIAKTLKTRPITARTLSLPFFFTSPRIDRIAPARPSNTLMKLTKMIKQNKTELIPRIKPAIARPLSYVSSLQT